MLVFQEHYKYRDPLNIVFLCGCSYGFKDASDKRNVLKSFIENTLPECQPIILEENFWFKKTNQQYLSYDDIFLNSLAHIEQLAALFAWKIIIVHESISTAAEIGAFAIDPSVAKKTCLLVPDSISIEEAKLSSFIQMAFLSKKSPESRILEKVDYYPDIEVVRKSPDKSDYYTFFHNNEIGESLGCRIKLFLNNVSIKSNVTFKKAVYGRLGSDENTVSYSINHKTKEIQVAVSPKVFKIQLLSLFFDEEFRRSIRIAKMIREHVTFTHSYFKEVMHSTIKMLSGEEIEGYIVKCKLHQTVCSTRQAIGYFLYMLQASKFISFEQINDDRKLRKITLSMSLEKCRHGISDLLYNTRKTTFGRLYK